MLLALRAPAGFYGIRSDGEIVLYQAEVRHGQRVEARRLVRNRTLAWTGRKQHELMALIYPRPVWGQDCPYCDYARSAEGHDNLICAYCGGLGWVPGTG